MNPNPYLIITISNMHLEKEVVKKKGIKIVFTADRTVYSMFCPLFSNTKKLEEFTEQQKKQFKIMKSGTTSI